MNEQPNPEAQKRKVIKNAGRRIAALFFDDKEDKFPFLDREFRWVENASIRPESTKAQKHPLCDIFNDIAEDLNSDELNRYAREAGHQQYFARAWKDPEIFRQAQQYFNTEYDGDSEHPIYAKTEKGADLIDSLGLLSTKAAVKTIDDAKADMLEFEFRMEQYQHALQYRLKGIQAIKSCIQTLLREHKGAFIAPSSKAATGTTSDFLADNADDVINYWNNLKSKGKVPQIGDNFLEQYLVEFIGSYLQDKGLDDPQLLDHIHTAALTAFTTSEKLPCFDPKPLEIYFDKLEKNIRVNMESCEPIRKLTKDTREHMDRIIQQECRKAGVTL